MQETKQKPYWGQNIWGRRWTLISILIILGTGILIYFLDKGERLLETREVQVEAAVNGKAVSSGEKYTIEFWSHPSDTPQYKLTQRKLMLYGISLRDEIKLVEKENELFLRRNNDLCQLVETSELLPLTVKKR